VLFLSHHCVFVCLFFVRLRISQRRKKDRVRYFACVFDYYPDRSSPIFVNFGSRGVNSGGVTSGVCAAPNLSQAMAPGEVRWLLGIGCRGSVENSELGAAALLKAVCWDLRLASLLTHLLWSPYVIGRTIIFSCCDLFFFPRLISAVGDWMSTIVPHMVWL